MPKSCSFWNAKVFQCALQRLELDLRSLDNTSWTRAQYILIQRNRLNPGPGSRHTLKADSCLWKLPDTKEGGGTSLTSLPGRISRKLASREVAAAWRTSAALPLTEVSPHTKECAATAIKPSMCTPRSLQFIWHFRSDIRTLTLSKPPAETLHWILPLSSYSCR